MHLNDSIVFLSFEFGSVGVDVFFVPDLEKMSKLSFLFKFRKDLEPTLSKHRSQDHPQRV